MHDRKVPVLILAAALALAGCATTGPRFSEIEARIPAVPADDGRIYFYRKSIFFGDGLRPPVKLNGQDVGRPVPNGFFFVDRPAGDYVVSTSTEVVRSLPLTLAKHEEKYVRFEATMGVFVGHISPELVDKNEALSELAGMHYVGTALGNQSSH
jgi:hypothetical protein